MAADAADKNIKILLSTIEDQIHRGFVLINPKVADERTRH